MRKYYRKNIVRKIVEVIVVAALAAGLTACEKTQKEYEEQALCMLEEKYKEEFTMHEYCSLDYLEGYYTVICYPKEVPQLLFKVKTACDGSYIEDEYISAVICHKAEQKIDENLMFMEGYLLEKVIPVSRLVDSSHADMSVEEFMSLKPKNRFAVYLMYCPEQKNAEKLYAEIQKTFQGLECVSGNIQLYIMQEEELKEMQGYFAGTEDLDYRFEKMTEHTERITIPFEYGKIQMPEEEFVQKAGNLI